MSIKAVKEFYEKIASDKDFQNKLNELQDKATEGLELPLAPDKKEEITKDVIIPFAKEQGFDFSIEDIKEFEQSIIEQLDEEQLKDISAGGIQGSSLVAGLGVGGIICKVIGVGAGLYISYGGGVCVLIGFGYGKGICLLAGSENGFDD